MKRRIISVSKSGKHNLRVYFSDATETVVRGKGKLTQGLHALLLAGTGWVEYPGKSTLFRCLVAGALQEFNLDGIVPTCLCYSDGRYFIGGVKGITLIDVMGTPEMRQIPVGPNGHAHIRSMAVKDGCLHWAAGDGTTGSISIDRINSLK